MENNDLTQLSEELIQRLGSGGDLGEMRPEVIKLYRNDQEINFYNQLNFNILIAFPEGMMPSELFHQGDLYMNNQDDSNSNVAVDNEIIMHMDIREPLRTLQ